MKGNIKAQMLYIAMFTRGISFYQLLENLKEKLKCWTTEYNNFPMKTLNWLNPNKKLAEFLA